MSVDIKDASFMVKNKHPQGSTFLITIPISHRAKTNTPLKKNPLTLHLKGVLVKADSSFHGNNVFFPPLLSSTTSHSGSRFASSQLNKTQTF